MGKQNNKAVYELKDEDLEFLKNGHGPLFKNMDEFERAVAGKNVYAVGDFTSYGLITQGRITGLKAVFYDGKTRRGPIPQYMLEGIGKWGTSEVEVKNPKGMITEQLVSAAKNCKPNTRIHIKGEEDLAALALFTVLDYGSIVAYGLPDKNGTCAVTVTPEIRHAALSLKGWKTKQPLRND